MIYPLYKHQEEIINEDRIWHGLFLGTGASKTRIALELAEGATLVVCPKQQKLDRTWEKNAEKFDIVINLKVMSKEEFRRDWETLPAYDTFIIDECHNNLGVVPETRQRKGILIPKTSQIFEATRSYLQKHPPKRFYLCSATPVSKPMHLWAIATLFGKDWDFFKFREKYYFPRLMGQRQIWLPRKDEATKQRLAELVKQLGYTGSLQDYFDVPEQTHKTVHIELSEPQKAAIEAIETSEADPLVKRAKMRTIENGVLYGKAIEEISSTVDKMVDSVQIFPSGKIDYILERAVEFPKMLIFATYTAQIKAIAEALKEEGYSVATLTGKTKDRGNLISNADKSDACIVVAQSSICEGYELPSFPCVIFASKSYRYVHYDQSLGRVLRSNALKKNLYIHLVVPDSCDEDCHNTIQSGADFQEMVMNNEE